MVIVLVCFLVVQPELGELRVLRWLNLKANHLSSVPGDYLRGLRKLETLDLSGNNLGALPENLPLLAALSSLDGPPPPLYTTSSAPLPPLHQTTAPLFPSTPC